MASLYFTIPAFCLLAIGFGAAWAAPSYAVRTGHGTPGTLTAEWREWGRSGWH